MHFFRYAELSDFPHASSCDSKMLKSAGERGRTVSHRDGLLCSSTFGTSGKSSALHCWSNYQQSRAGLASKPYISCGAFAAAGKEYEKGMQGFGVSDPWLQIEHDRCSSELCLDREMK